MANGREYMPVCSKQNNTECISALFFFAHFKSSLNPIVAHLHQMPMDMIVGVQCFLGDIDPDGVCKFVHCELRLFVFVNENS